MRTHMVIAALAIMLASCQSHVASYQMSPQNRLELQERLKQKCLEKGVAANSRAMKHCISLENRRRDQKIEHRDAVLEERLREKAYERAIKRAHKRAIKQKLRRAG